MPYVFNPFTGTLDAITTPIQISEVLASVTGINAKTIALTTLYTVPAGKTLTITGVFLRVTAFTSGGKTTDAIMTVGANNPNYDDYNGISPAVVSNNVAIEVTQSLGAFFPIYTAGQVIKMNITTGSNATTETWAIELLGYLS